MVVDFPIRVDIQNAVFGAILASVPHRAEFGARLVELFAAGAGLNPSDPSPALKLQETLYHRTVDQLRQLRRVLGHPAGGDDLYSLPWFLLSFHGWTAVATLRGMEKIGWLRSNDDLSTIQRCLYELGIDCTVDQVNARLLFLAGEEPRTADLRSVDFDNYALLEQASYLSSAAIRTGHRVGLEAPAQSIFISYAHKDREYVDRLVIFLEAHAVKVWYDTSDLKSGSKLDERLRREIESRECLVFVLTRQSLKSAYVALEVAAAIDLGKNVLPVSLVPLQELTEMVAPDGRDLYPELLRYPIVEASASSPIEAYEDVLRSLQRVGPDLTRWKQDEGSHLSLFRDLLAPR